MNAIYARQSVDRADSISIESQIGFCRYEMRGESWKVYADRGYSGKNTERPAFAEMMRDIEQGSIRKVVVYKLDRISRSILDFSGMMEQFERHGVEFVSTTEKFDTSSPMGRAMLNICIVFAQLERETIQRRVSDAYYSRSRKGLYMGGRVPYGFRLIPTTLQGIRTSMYEIEEEEAEQIRLIYRMYADPLCSCGDIVRLFQQTGITRRGKPWGRTRLAELLRNPIYVRADLSVYRYFQRQGAVIVNEPGDFIGRNGCYCYRVQDSGRPGQSRPAGQQLVLAPHEGIIAAPLWLACREKCAQPTARSPAQKAKHSWLAGKIKCARCGYALVEKHFPGGKGRYLFCSNKLDTGACEGPGTVCADALEALIRREMQKKLEQFPCLRSPDTGSPDRAQSEVMAQLAQLEREIAQLLERMGGADEVLFRYIGDRLRELDRQKQSLTERLLQLQNIRLRSRREICRHPTIWEELSFDDKRKVTDCLVRVICAASDSVRIEWKL